MSRVLGWAATRIVGCRSVYIYLGPDAESRTVGVCSTCRIAEWEVWTFLILPTSRDPRGCWRRCDRICQRPTTSRWNSGIPIPWSSSARLAASVVILAAGAMQVAAQGNWSLSLSLLQTKQKPCHLHSNKKALVAHLAIQAGWMQEGEGVNASVAGHHVKRWRQQLHMVRSMQSGNSRDLHRVLWLLAAEGTVHFSADKQVGHSV